MGKMFYGSSSLFYGSSFFIFEEPKYALQLISGPVVYVNVCVCGGGGPTVVRIKFFSAIGLSNNIFKVRLKPCFGLTMPI